MGRIKERAKIMNEWRKERYEEKLGEERHNGWKVWKARRYGRGKKDSMVKLI